jgi:hypothetical protein
VIRVNLLAAKQTRNYIAQCRAQGLYPLGYYPHNLHFIWMGATASGQKELAMESAYRLANAIPQEALASVPILQGFIVVPYWAMVRFGEWDRILDDKGPRHETPFTLGAWRFARAMALTRRAGWITPSRNWRRSRHYRLTRHSTADDVLEQHRAGDSSDRAEVVAGEIAAKRKDWDSAVLHLDRAIRYEDSLIYQEPPDWHAPVRQNLAAVHVAAGRADEAEAVLWKTSSGTGECLGPRRPGRGPQDPEPPRRGRRGARPPRKNPHRRRGPPNDALKLS